MTSLAGLLFALLCVSAAAAEVPKHVTLSYQLIRDGLPVAEVTEALEHDGKRYTIVSDAVTSGIAALFSKGGIQRGSKGTVTPDGLRPEIYRDERTGRSPAVARFDWAARSITLEAPGGKQQMPLPDPAHDRLSFLYSFAFRLLQGGDYTFAMTDGRHLTRYRYLIVGQDHLATPMGNLETLKLARDQQEDGQGSEIWLALRYHWLPARIRVTEKDGTVIDQVVTAIRY
ncbi:MAG: DUF3108 domain-containing protein [Betaproteobacteria bacterium]|nr:DUF3108 domain-containing protein [Betaproteobacteria bacterium]